MALQGLILDRSSMFSIKTLIQLKDCDNNIIYTSKVGKSNLKEYTKGYHEAIRNAFNSMSDFKYRYKKDPIKQGKEDVLDEIVSKEVLSPITIGLPNVKNKVLNETGQVSIRKNSLYAQENTHGFQLINKTRAVVFILLKTTIADVFILKNKNGILYKNEDSWVAEYYKNDTVIIEKYQITF